MQLTEIVADSREYVRVPVCATKNGLPFDPTTREVQFSFMEGDGYAPRVARVNLCTNPKAKTDTSDWVPGTSATISRVTNWSSEGVPTPTLPDGTGVSTGFKVTGPSQQYSQGIANYYLDPAPTSSITAYLLVYDPQNGHANSSVMPGFTSSEQNPSNYDDAYVNTPDMAAAWRLVRVHLPANDLRDTAFIYVNAYGYDTAYSGYFTAVMIEPILSEYPYADGDSEGWEWNLDGSSAAVDDHWYDGTWETVDDVHYAMCLVNGPNGFVPESEATYSVYVRVADSPEVPVKYAGLLKVR